MTPGLPGNDCAAIKASQDTVNWPWAEPNRFAMVPGVCSPLPLPWHIVASLPFSYGAVQYSAAVQASTAPTRCTSGGLSLTHVWSKLIWLLSAAGSTCCWACCQHLSSRRQASRHCLPALSSSWPHVAASNGCRPGFVQPVGRHCLPGAWAQLHPSAPAPAPHSASPPAHA